MCFQKDDLEILCTKYSKRYLPAEVGRPEGSLQDFVGLVVDLILHDTVRAVP